jgi:quinoprotein glucose dehydrogenase
MRVLKSGWALGLTLAAAVVAVGFARAADGTASGEWRFYAGDAASTKYSPLDQINASNVSQLQIAWRWTTANFGPRLDYNWEATPLMVHDVLYVTAGSRRDPVAIDAVTGETLWMARYDEGPRGANPARTLNRGLAYWSDGAGDERILSISPGFHLLELDAKTGNFVSAFGTGGVVDLFEGLDRETVANGSIGSSSPAIVVNDVIVVGAAHIGGGSPRSKSNTPGYIRGYDVHTGKRLWTFRTIPHPGEFGNETWEDNSWEYTGNTGAWAPLSADLELGYVYVPVETPTGDFYGGTRPGNNLFAESLVCLDAKTGKRVWHYQFVHHGIWDFDIASPPILLDAMIDGRMVKAVAQPTKQSFLYVFDRVTGKPVWDIVERPVPQSDVPGEKTSPTQPFPTKPAPYDRQGMSVDDLIDFTPELRKEAIEIASHYRMRPLFTPPSLAIPNGTQGTLQLPDPQGGANWPGGAYDPETGMLYVSSVTNPVVVTLAPNAPGRSDFPYANRGGSSGRGRGAGRTNFGPQGLPLVRPPWGRITAIDMHTGNHVWMKANGEAPEYVKNNPALEGIDLSNTGRPERAPLLVTKTLLISGDGAGLFTTAPGGGGNKFRVYDKKTGAVIYEREMPANMTGVPMTYLANGKQYIVFAMGAAGVPAELVALTLP